MREPSPGEAGVSDAAPAALALGAALATFALFAVLAPAGPYWLDSSELSAAAVGLGSAHATGFPLYMHLAKLVSWLPLGELAWRVHLASAVSAAIAVGFVVRLVTELSTAPRPAASIAAAAAGLCLALTTIFLRQATVAEVYAPTAAMIAASLWLAQRVAAGASARVGLGLALLAGLGFGLHGSYRLVMALPLLALFALRLYRGARWPLFAPLVSATAAVAIHLYLPARSLAADGLLDWGHPRTLSGLWYHANASGIREAFADEMFSDRGLLVADSARRFGEQLIDYFGPLGVLAALGGVFVLAWRRRSRAAALALAAIAALDACYAIWINPMGLGDLQNGVPLVVVAAIAAGVGVAALAATLSRASAFAAAALGVGLALPPALVSLPETLAGQSGELPRRHAEAILDAVPLRGLLLTRSDSASANAVWMTTVEGARPDIAPLVRQLIPDTPRTAAALARSGLAISGGFGSAAELLAATPRAALWEYGDDNLPPQRRPELGALAARLGDGPGLRARRPLSRLSAPSWKPFSAPPALSTASPGEFSPTVFPISDVSPSRWERRRAPTLSFAARSGSGRPMPRRSSTSARSRPAAESSSSPSPSPIGRSRPSRPDSALSSMPQGTPSPSAARAPAKDILSWRWLSARAPAPIRSRGLSPRRRGGSRTRAVFTSAPYS